MAPMPDKVDGYSVAEGNGYWVAVSTRMTPELIGEGVARDLIHALQAMRREAGFDIRDRIEVRYVAGELVSEVMAEYGGLITEEVLATSMKAGEGSGNGRDMSIDGEGLRLWITKTGGNMMPDKEQEHFTLEVQDSVMGARAVVTDARVKDAPETTKEDKENG